MGTSVFKKTYYLGLSIILIPIIFCCILLFSIFVVGTSKEETEVKPEKEIVVKKEQVIVHDTVYISKPKVTTKVSPEPKISDTTKPTDTFTSKN